MRLFSPVDLSMKHLFSFEVRPRVSRRAAACAAVALMLAATPLPVLAQAPIAATAQPAPSTPRIASDINILILALDEVDLKSALPSNLAGEAPRTQPQQVKPLPDLPIAPVAEKTGANANGDKGARQLPAAPARARVPAGALPDGELSALAPASAPLAAASWDALAQIAPTIPNLPPLSESEREADVELPNRRPPGRAQNAAAPLRRALVKLGVSDVLATPLDGPVVVRSVNSGRLAIKTLDRLRFSTQQILNDLGSQTEAPARVQSQTMATRTASRIGMALGYRAVVVLALAPGGEYSLLLVDAARETGNAFVVPKGDTENAAALIAAQLSQWTPFTAADRVAEFAQHMDAARAAIEKGELETARDNLLQAVALDASSVEAYVLLGDVLQNTDPVAAASAYQRAAEINTRDGEVWARIAIVHTLSSPPDWVRSLAAAAKAQTLGYDSANLRTAMAAAEFGRADLFRRNGRADQAEDAELIARRHLERAREMAPDDPEVAAGVSRLMAKYLLEQKRYSEAVQSLDLLAIQYPDDLQTQKMYAEALEGYGKRPEDLFAAWARVWKLGGDSDIALDANRYTRITDGFDQRLFALGKNVFQMTSGVATGALPRETALLQAERSRDEMKMTIDALQLMRPPATRSVSDAHNSRLFAADLMQQAVEFYLLYLETGAEINRSRAVEIHRSAIEALNTARLGGQSAVM
jgi:tetratricopeptide (TPR) repeat protein